ncbi:hypothetical protein KAR91_60130 [Candidatus Pacearchaeota archaeon]|nr:hypothetical protein [Candidatus Pacearchaeota archaeon]
MAFKFTQRKVLSIVKKSDGNMSFIQKALGLKAWGSANQWVQKWPATRKAFNALKKASIQKKTLAKKRPPENKARSNGKHPGGTPPKFKDEFIEKAQMFGIKGFTDTEMAMALDVSPSTICLWKKERPGFLKSYEAGKEIADSNVKRSMYERARGYSHKDVHISNYRGKITITPIIKHYPPDTSAGTFWLKNRDPDNFKDKHEIDGNLGIDLAAPITVSVVGKEPDKK